MIRDLSLDDAKILVVKRIVNAMSGLLLNTSSAEDTRRLEGLGLALAFCFEEFVGISARDKKPSELIVWGIELPEPAVRRVS